MLRQLQQPQHTPMPASIRECAHDTVMLLHTAKQAGQETGLETDAAGCDAALNRNGISGNGSRSFVGRGLARAAPLPPRQQLAAAANRRSLLSNDASSRPFQSTSSDATSVLGNGSMQNMPTLPAGRLMITRDGYSFVPVWPKASNSKV